MGELLMEDLLTPELDYQMMNDMYGQQTLQDDPVFSDDVEDLPEGFSVVEQPNDVLPEGFSVVNEQQSQQEVGIVSDFTKSLLSSLGDIPRAAARFGSEKIRPLLGKEPLSPEQLQEVYKMGGAQEYKPQSTAGNIGEFLGALAPYAIAPGSTIPKAMLSSGLLEGTRAYGKGGNPLAYGAGSALLTGGISKGLEAGVPLIETLLKKTSPALTNILTGIPQEATERALTREFTGKSLFKGKYEPEQEFKKLGQNVLEGIKFVEEKAGKMVQAEKEALNDFTDKISTENIINTFDNILNEVNPGGINTLTPSDTGAINQIKQILLRGELSPIELYGLKKKIQNAVTYSGDMINALSNQGQFALKTLAKNIDDLLVDISPNYKKAMNEYSAIKNLEQKIGFSKLKDLNISKTIANIDTDANIQSGMQDLLQSLDDALPNKYKFAEKVRDINARGEFERLTPFTPSPTVRNRMEQQKSIEQLKMLGLFGAGLGLAKGGTSLAGTSGLASLLLQSPKVQQKLIQSMGLSKKAAELLGNKRLGIGTTALTNQLLEPLQGGIEQNVYLGE